MRLITTVGDINMTEARGKRMMCYVLRGSQLRSCVR